MVDSGVRLHCPRCGDSTPFHRRMYDNRWVCERCGLPHHTIEVHHCTVCRKTTDMVKLNGDNVFRCPCGAELVNPAQAGTPGSPGRGEGSTGCAPSAPLI